MCHGLSPRISRLDHPHGTKVTLAANIRKTPYRIVCEQEVGPLPHISLDIYACRDQILLSKKSLRR